MKEKNWKIIAENLAGILDAKSRSLIILMDKKHKVYYLTICAAGVLI